MGDFFGHDEKSLSDRDKRLFEKHAAPNQKGHKTMANLFCEDQLCASPEYIENFDKIEWKKGGCQNAMCPYFNTDDCMERQKEITIAGIDPKYCKHNKAGR